MKKSPEQVIAGGAFLKTKQMAKKKTATAKQPKKETTEANDKRKAAKKSKAKTVKVEITGGVAWLGLPHNVGQVAELEEKQGEEVVNANRGKYVK
ncbi:MAG: hypothetical protein CMC13_00260 [Flavobacteriaceae bacterium]|mgnify:CR=1 FL=1|nr:hypothetical protein [Flavobacteriaceae bacterium]